MKKVLFILGAAALMLASCAKSETVVKENAGEISFKAVTSSLTKGAELDGTAFPTDNSRLIYVGASTAEQKQFLNDQMFSYCTTKWEASSAAGTASPVYWPIGGKTVDFLAYALKPADKSTLAPAFPTGDAVAASKFTISAWDTYTDQADLLYAVANGYKNQAAAVPLEFKHALALIIVNVRHNSGGGDFAITNINFGEKNTTGTLEVNNERNNIALNWSALSTATLDVPATSAAGSATTVIGPNGAAAGCVKYTDVITKGASFYQLGETLLVIPQAASNPVITYTLDGKTYVYEPNALRLNWEAGKAYIYDFSFNNNEITVAPTVVDWVEVDPS